MYIKAFRLVQTYDNSLEYAKCFLYLCNKRMDSAAMRVDEELTPTIPGRWGEEVFPLLSWFRLDKVRNANVMVVGCGALGNEVLKNLALFGVEHLVIVDFDTIELSNLTRSILFTPEDAAEGRPKAIVAAERLRKINPAIQVLPIVGDIAHDVGLGLLRRMDVVVACVDNRWARYCLNRLCMRMNRPWVDGGIDGLEGTARVFVPGKNCYACGLGPEALKDLSFRLSCASVIRRNIREGRMPTTPVVASIIGAVEAQEAIKLLHPEELARGELTSLCGKMYYYEGQHLASRIVDFSAYDDDCPVHERWEPIEKIESLTTGLRVDDALARLSERFGGEPVELCLRDFRFVDYLVDREDDRRYVVSRPDYAVERFVEESPVLRYKPFHSFYQHEFGSIDMRFPYPELTLKEIGVTGCDVVPVRVGKAIRYVELGDELDYSIYLSTNTRAS